MGRVTLPLPYGCSASQVYLDDTMHGHARHASAGAWRPGGHDAKPGAPRCSGLVRKWADTEALHVLQVAEDAAGVRSACRALAGLYKLRLVEGGVVCVLLSELVARTRLVRTPRLG